MKKQYNMATLLKSDGSSTSNVEIDTLQQQQALVGGYIEYVPVVQNMHELLIINEEGRLQDMPEINEVASLLAGQVIVGDAVLVHIEELEKDSSE